MISIVYFELTNLNLEKCVCDKTYFFYTMPNDEVMAKIPSDTVKITSIKYEKQIDSLLVGFNFGCFQIWNMKTLTIESSSQYAQVNRPTLGFALLEPQNDPKKCLYLLIAHSSLIEQKPSNKYENEIDFFFILNLRNNFK